MSQPFAQTWGGTTVGDHAEATGRLSPLRYMSRVSAAAVLRPPADGIFTKLEAPNEYGRMGNHR
jgi:hypothetical protein